jgi:2-oxoisovalerate dehydrogenase E2 component (dihydrolipoyl transacylase)
MPIKMTNAECMWFNRSVKPPGLIQAFDPLCEVQSDKASVEITSPFDGVVKELLVQEGEVAKVGDGLCLIEVDEEAAQNSPDLEPLSPSAENHMDPTPFFDSMESISDLKEQETTLCEKPISNRRLHPLDPNYSDASSAASSNILATPSVRHFSRQKGVNLAKLAPGSGKDGRIEKKDVEAYLAKATAGGIAGGEVQGGKDVVVELGRTRYGMWKAMVKVYIIPFDDNHPILI